MKKTLLSLVFLLASVMSLVAQDVIYFNNGTQQKGTVTEINSNEVKYKKAENPNGPLYVVTRSEVQMIEYSNGEKDILTSVNTNQETQSDPSANYRNQDTHINNYYSNPRPRVQVVVPPPGPVWGWGYVRPYYRVRPHYHHHHHHHPRGWR